MDVSRTVATTDDIADGAVTQAKRAALGQSISSSSGAFSTTNTSLTDVTNLSRTITTTGRPVWIGLVSDGSANEASILCTSNSTATNGSIAFLQGSSSISIQTVGVSNPASGASSSSIFYPVTNFYHIDAPTAGTYTYKVQVKINGSGTIVCQYAKLLVYEL